MRAIAAATASALTLQGSRWLAVDQLSGQVSLIPYRGTRRQARISDRFSNERLSRAGRFDLVVPLFEDSAANNPKNRYLQSTVITPLGTEQQYELVVP